MIPQATSHTLTLGNLSGLSLSTHDCATKKPNHTYYANSNCASVWTLIWRPTLLVWQCLSRSDNGSMFGEQNGLLILNIIPVVICVLFVWKGCLKFNNSKCWKFTVSMFDNLMFIIICSLLKLLELQCSLHRIQLNHKMLFPT